MYTDGDVNLTPANPNRFQSDFVSKKWAPDLSSPFKRLRGLVIETWVEPLSNVENLNIIEYWYLCFTPCPVTLAVVQLNFQRMIEALHYRSSEAKRNETQFRKAPKNC